MDKILLLVMPCEYFCTNYDRPLRFSAAGASQFEGLLKNESVHYYDLDAYILKNIGRFEKVFPNHSPADFYKIAKSYSQSNEFKLLFEHFRKLIDFSISYDFILCSMPVYYIADVEDELMLIFNYIILKFLRDSFPQAKIAIGGSSIFVLNNFLEHNGLNFSEVVNLVCYDKLETSKELYSFLYNNQKEDPQTTWVPKHGLQNFTDLQYTNDYILDFYKVPRPPVAYDPKQYLMQCSMRMSYGCVGRCAFCGESSKSFQLIDPHISYDTIKRYLDLGFNSIFFKDNTINPSRKHTEQFCNWIVKNNLKFTWTASARFHNTDADFFNMCYESGCRRLCFGTEMPTDRMLKYVGKGITKDKMIEGLINSHNAGIWNLLNFIFGIPYEAEDDIIEAIDFIQDYDSYIDHYIINRFYMNWISLFALNAKDYDLEIGKEYIRRHGRLSKQGKEKRNDIDKRNYHYAKTYREINGLGSDAIEDYKDRLMKSLDPLFRKCHQKAIPQHLMLALYNIFREKSKVKSWVDQYFRPYALTNKSEANTKHKTSEELI